MTTSTLSCNLSEEMQKKLAACEQEVRNRCRALSSELVSYLALQSASLCLMITSLTPDPPLWIADFIEIEFRKYLINHQNIIRLFDQIRSEFPATSETPAAATLSKTPS